MKESRSFVPTLDGFSTVRRGRRFVYRREEQGEVSGGFFCGGIFVRFLAVPMGIAGSERAYAPFCRRKDESFLFMDLRLLALCHGVQSRGEGRGGRGWIFPINTYFTRKK